jgi:hypothetical protein
MNAYYAYVAFDKTNNALMFSFSSDFLSDVMSLGQSKTKANPDWRLYMWIGPFPTRSTASYFVEKWRQTAVSEPLSAGARLAARVGLPVYSFSSALKLAS